MVKVLPGRVSPGFDKEPVFKYFPPAALVASLSEPSVSRGRVSVVPPVVVPGGLVITNPAADAIVAPGSSVRVTVEPVAGTDVQSVVVVGPGTAAVDDVAPFELDLEIPAETSGRFLIQAVGDSGTASFPESNTLSLRTLPEATIDSLEILTPDPVMLAVGRSRRLIVLGA
jgi:hypothetical protein